MILPLTSEYQRAEIVVPIADFPATARGPRHIDIGFHSPSDVELGRVVYRVREALRNTHTQLSGGRHVETYADTVRYLLERIGAATRRGR